MRSPDLYPSTITIKRKRTASRDATGHIQEDPVTAHRSIPASVQTNRAATGATGNHRMARGTLEQPVTVRIYTPTDVSDVRKDDIVQDDLTGATYQVLQSVDQADRSGSWRIEASNL